MPLQDAVNVVPLLGAIAGCHCSVLWLSGHGAIAGCHCSVQWTWLPVDMVPLLGCHCSVLWLSGRGDDQLCLSGRGAIAGCHCRVPVECGAIAG